jgi:hypothetical protein
MLDIISDNVMIVLLMSMATIALTCLPLILNHLREERKEKQNELEKQREFDARRNREEDISVLLGNVLKVDTIMDYVLSRGGNKEGNERESNCSQILDIIKANTK